MVVSIAELQTALSAESRIFDDPSSLRIYSFDQGEVPPKLRKTLFPDSSPDLAVQPATVEDLHRCVRYGLDRSIPLVPRGAATFGMGGAVPHHGGLLLDLSVRREIYDFDAVAGTICVGAGCRWSDVSEFLQPLGFDLCSYPTSWYSTVGGWASTGGVGTGCTKYGSFHDRIEAITVVTAAGEKWMLHRSDPDFAFFLGTEGQMGAIWDITFRVRKKPVANLPFLLLFDSVEEAIETASQLLKRCRPYHLKFLDAHRIHEINHLLKEEHPTLASDKCPVEKHTLLVCFDDAESAADFRRWTQEKALYVASDFKAHLLWRERMFPLRVKRIAWGLLASELILPLEKIAPFVKKAANLGQQFGVNLATECYFLPDGSALTLPVYTFDASRSIEEALKASLSYILTYTGIRMGGRPYGIGIWHAPFLKHKFGRAYEGLKKFKQNLDPEHLFNPGKFFEMKFRSGFAGKLASLPLRRWLVPLWAPLNPILASLLIRKNGHSQRPEDLILQNEELCSKCGSCISVCPAYIATQDERTTARGKLQLGKWILNGGAITAEEANVLFLCMHCGACTDVCQSRLNLVPVWDELERRVENQFGKDLPRVQKFFESVEQKKIMGVPYARGSTILAGHQSE